MMGRGASLVPVLLFLAGCATTPGGGPEALEESDLYVFGGTIAGETVEGDLEFPETGGYLVRSSRGVCDRTGDRGAMVLRAQSGDRTLTLGCGDLRLQIRVVNGALLRHGSASIQVVEMRERRGRCAEYDPDTGACVRWLYITVPVKVTRSGTIRIDTP